MRAVLLVTALLYAQLATAGEQIALVIQERPGYLAFVVVTRTEWGAVVAASGLGGLDFAIDTPIDTEEFLSLVEAVSELPESYSFTPSANANMAAPEFFNIRYVLDGQTERYRIELNEENEKIPIVAELTRYIPEKYRKAD